MTRTLAAITRRKYWATSYKLMERGSVCTLRLAQALLELINKLLLLEILNLVIDDTLIPCHSETAPGSIIWHDHARKTNWPQYLQA